MLFNSVGFPIFLAIVFSIYWLIGEGRIRAQNFLLLVASYVFYGWWDWRFLGLIFVSSLVDYLVGAAMEREDDAGRRKVLLVVSLCTNLGILGVFKYYDFFVDSMISLLTTAGLRVSVPSLRLILPVGISFYTFQTLSYTIDIYRKQIHAETNPFAFFAFVSFFPQLVAGPIERAARLLPQFTKPRGFDLQQAKDGLRQCLWGLFKKVVVADSVAVLVDHIFSQYYRFNGLTLAAGTVFFAIQIYCDFSGYSDIAIGTARLFGFKIMRNFAYPYFSRDIGEFWHRWHISLSSWFRDYLYIPLGGNRVGRLRRILNVLITFTVSGLWHGGNWTFVFWGLLNGLYYIPQMVMGWGEHATHTVAENRWLPNPREGIQLLGTFVLVNFAWIFFRAPSMSYAFSFIRQMFSHPFDLATVPMTNHVLLCSFVLGAEWVQREKQHGLQIADLAVPVRWAIYYGLIGLVLFFGQTNETPFIYFQF